MYTKLATLLESTGPNRYFEVNGPLELFVGKSSGAGHFPSYSPLTLQAGDQLHWLHGGLFAIKDGNSVESVHTSNPDKDGMGDYYARKNNMDGFRAHQLEKLLKAKKIVELSKQDAEQDVKYRG